MAKEVLLVVVLFNLAAALPVSTDGAESNAASPQLRVAAVQMRSSRDLTANLKRITESIHACGRRGVRIVAFPECALSGYFADAVTRLSAERLEEAGQRVADACREAGVYAVVGSAWIEAGKLLDSALIFSPEGEIIERYDKIQLAEEWPEGGERMLVFHVDRVPCSVIICHDERYPELVRLPVLAGAQVIFYISHESGLRAEHKMEPYRAQIQARAVENNVFVVQANAPANRDASGSHGQSRLIGPDGNIIHEASLFEEDILMATLDLRRATRGNALRSLTRGPLQDWWKSGLSRVRIGESVRPASARQMENLTRGIVAVPRSDGSVYVGWRLLGTDPENVAFNLYRAGAGTTPVKVNQKPITDCTNYSDSPPGGAADVEYFVRPIVRGNELAPTEPAALWTTNYLEIPIQPIPDYRPGDASIADLDGDGRYEIVLHQTCRGRDNSFAGMTGTPVLDAYELDGSLLWRIDLGINIREGQHYTQFLVYDLDGDGKAELACKTADGTKDGLGNVIGDPSRDWRNHDQGSRLYGRILDGPEYFTIFDGQNGEALATVDYVPGRDPINGWGGIGGNGGNDAYGNRCDRFLGCAAYLDGSRPSVVMCRGVYGRIVMAAWDWRDGALTRRWVFDSGISYPPFTDASPYSGMGGHSLSVADVDSDGKDEIVYQAMTVDDNGQGLYSTGRRHGDSMHISDFYPDRPGLELFLISENEGSTVRFQTPGVGVHDARTGEVIWSHSPGIDVGSGMAADIDPRYPGYEAWGGPGGLRNARGEEVGPKPRESGWVIWWDDDLLRELLTGGNIDKWNWESGTEERLLSTDAHGGGRGPNLMGDFLGDWREELLLTAPGGRSLRLYTTTLPTQHRLVTLMHDPQYRLAIAWQNVVYNKPPHPSFFLGHGMTPPPRPHIRLVGHGEAIAPQ